jgi:peptide/nickel transport system permease protein
MGYFVTWYIIKRLLFVIPTLLIVAIVTFSLVHFIPGGPASMIIGINATPQQVAEINTALGLDKPLPEQFVTWIGNAIKGDFGVSFSFRQPVMDLINIRLPITLQLTLVALIISLIIGLPAGIYSATRQGTIKDQIVQIIAMIGVATPDFWLGMMLITFIAVPVKWFPTGGFISFSHGFIPWLQHIILPGFSLGFLFAAVTTRMTRSSMLDVLNEDYIKTARAKGQSERVVLAKHALKNAVIPVITVVGISITSMIGGAVIVEEVFSIPGMGRLLVGAISSRDYPVIQGCIFIIACIIILVNLIVDLLYKALNPRITLVE